MGEENYTSRLASEVKKEKKVNSELLGSMRRVTHFTSFLIIPLGIILFLESYLLRNASVETAVVSSSAALLGMLPKGLVLLIFVSLAAGVIRLARMKILVQNIYSLETLAHIDPLCLDKTGTITDGRLKVRAVLPLTELPKGEVDVLVQSYMAASVDNNATFHAMKEKFPPREIYQVVSKIPFSSKRKWGCVNLERTGSDVTEEDYKFMEHFVKNAVYDDYDRLVQLCDSLALPSGFCLLEKRFVDVALRYGTPSVLAERWRRTLEIRDMFEKKINGSIYNLLPGVEENTFR